MLFQPTLTPILANRVLSFLITCIAIVQTLLTVFQKPGWICPTRNYLGCPCPGCGLTRAMLAFLSGDFKTMVSYHAMAPFFFMGLVVTSLAAFLPKPLRQSYINRLEWWETHTGATRIFLILLVAYWLVRLIFLNQVYISLIMN